MKYLDGIIGAVLVCISFAVVWLTQDLRYTGAIAFVGVLLDWQTTRYMSKHYADGFSEANSQLGPYPSTRAVDKWFMVRFGAVVFLLVLVIWVSWMPSDNERLALVVLSGINLGIFAVHGIKGGFHNLICGLKLDVLHR